MEQVASSFPIAPTFYRSQFRFDSEIGEDQTILATKKQFYESSQCRDESSSENIVANICGSEAVDPEVAFNLSGTTEIEKALNLIEQMRNGIGESLRVSRESLDDLEVHASIACILDKLSECENSLLEKDRVSLALLGKNGVGKSFLINILLLLTSPISGNYGYRNDKDMKSLFSEDFEQYIEDLQTELEAVIELQRNSPKQVKNSIIACLLVDSRRWKQEELKHVDFRFLDIPSDQERDEREKEERLFKMLSEAATKWPGMILIFVACSQLSFVLNRLMPESSDGDQRHQYILPSLDLGTSTTAIAIPVRYGKVFHMRIDLKTEDCLRKVFALFYASPNLQLEEDDSNDSSCLQ